jgi:hypothetical protein
MCWANDMNRATQVNIVKFNFNYLNSGAAVFYKRRKGDSGGYVPR